MGVVVIIIIIITVADIRIFGPHTTTLLGHHNSQRVNSKITLSILDCLTKLTIIHTTSGISRSSSSSRLNIRSTRFFGSGVAAAAAAAAWTPDRAYHHHHHCHSRSIIHRRIGISTEINTNNFQPPSPTTIRNTISLKMSTNTHNDDDGNIQKVIDGKQIAATIREEIRLSVAQRVTDQLPVPGLAVILVGQRRDSQTYVNMKKKACQEAGIISMGYDFEESVTEEELLATIHELNHSPSVHGILIQLPLPKHLNQDTILRAVDPKKDVDGLHPINTAALQLYHDGNAMDAPFSIPCTPLGCLELLDRSGVELSGRHCVVIGRSQLVGLPMARLLLGRDATVTMCHSKTSNPAALVSQADVVVVAIGKAQFVTADWIKPGAVVIDVGINSIDVIVPEEDATATTATTTKKKPSYRLVGDVHYDDCFAKCSKITPVPGGVGPMTIAMLLRNTLRSCERASP